MKHIRTATINGVRWIIDWSKPEGAAWGMCHWDEHRIQIDPDIDEVTAVSVLADEICHVHFDCLDNDCVDSFSDDVAKVLRDCDLIKSEVDEH